VAPDVRRNRRRAVTTKDSRPHGVVRIALVSPPLDASGGIGRLMSYVMTGLDLDQIRIRHIDSRGRSKSPILSALPLLRACVVLIVLRARRRVDLAHINLSYRGSTIRKCTIAWLSYAMRIPTVMHLHACEYEEFFDRLPTVLQRLICKTFQRADRVIVLGHVWERFLVDELHVPEERVTVLYNASPGPVAPAPAKSGRFAHEAVHLLFLGQLGTRKGVPELLTALSRSQTLPIKWSLTMAGDGDVDGAKKRCHGLGIGDRTTFTGWVNPDRVQSLLEWSDVLILPSHAEGSPMVIVEAFAHGVSVIATPVGAIPEIVEDGKSGLLVPVGDIDALQEAIESLCVDEALRTALSLSGRRAWETRFAIDPYTEQLVQLWIHTAEPNVKGEGPALDPEPQATADGLSERSLLT
jgi:glycosyltransferase involved in cell wall biosynthesis